MTDHLNSSANSPSPEVREETARRRLEAESSSWLDRAYAAGIDALIVIGITAPVMALLVAIAAINGPRYNGELSTQFFFTLFLVITIVVFFYATLSLALRDGQTLGKQFLNIRVVRHDGDSMTLGRSAFREIVAKQILFGLVAALTFGTIQIADVLWPFVDKQKRTLHDIVARTRVIDGDA